MSRKPRSAACRSVSYLAVILSAGSNSGKALICMCSVGGMGAGWHSRFPQVDLPCQRTGQESARLDLRATVWSGGRSELRRLCLQLTHSVAGQGTEQECHGCKEPRMMIIGCCAVKIPQDSHTCSTGRAYESGKVTCLHYDAVNFLH